jgi:hypothetical protein
LPTNHISSAAHLERGEEKLPRGELQEAHPCICHWRLKEKHQLLAEAEAATNSHSSSKQAHQHSLPQLLKVIPNWHLEKQQQEAIASAELAA